MTCVCPLRLASSNAVSRSCRRGSEGKGCGGGGGRRGGSGRGAAGGAEGRRGAYAGPLLPTSPTPAPRPQAPSRLPPRPSAPSRTLSLRRASAPALSSASTQGAWPLQAAMCSAVLLFCRDAAAAAHTRVKRRRQAGGWWLEAEGERPRGLGGRMAGRRSRGLWRQAWHPWRRGARGSRACRREPPT